MEVMSAISERGGIEQADIAVQCALLHDVVEDTSNEVDDLRRRFIKATRKHSDAVLEPLRPCCGHVVPAARLASRPVPRIVIY
jgi:hypothetical protein